jgi:hypothetical protein
MLMADDAVRAGMPVAGQLVFRAVEEIIDLLEVLSDERPLLLELDDLHWADGSTLTAVLWAPRRLTEIPLLLVGTLRPTPRDRDLAQLVEEAMRSGATLAHDREQALVVGAAVEVEQFDLRHLDSPAESMSPNVRP